MAVIFELLGRIVFETLAYGIGKPVAVVFFPHLKIEPFQKQKSMPPWKWRGFTYERGSHRYLYTESIQLLGLGAMALLGFATFVIVRYANQHTP